MAIWWMLSEHPSEPDALSLLVEDLVGRPPGSATDRDRPPFQLDDSARRAELADAGFIDIDSEVIGHVVELDAAKARALYASMAAVLRRPHHEQARVLDAVEATVQGRFGGRLRREFVTAIYTARDA